jgi:hypothetical protein
MARESDAQSQRQALVFLRRVADPVEQAARGIGIEQRLASRDAPDGVHDVSALDLFQDIAGRTAHDRLEERLVVGKRREHEALDLGRVCSDRTAHPDTVTIGKPDVEHRDIRLGGGMRASASAACALTTSKPPCD